MLTGVLSKHAGTMPRRDSITGRDAGTAAR